MLYNLKEISNKEDNFDSQESEKSKSGKILSTGIISPSSSKNENLESFNPNFTNHADVISNFKNTIANSENSIRLKQSSLLSDKNLPINKCLININLLSKNSSNKSLLLGKIEDMKKSQTNLSKNGISSSYIDENIFDHGSDSRLNQITDSYSNQFISKPKSDGMRYNKGISIYNFPSPSNQWSNISDQVPENEILKQGNTLKSINHITTLSSSITEDNLSPTAEIKKKPLKENHSKNISFNKSNVSSITHDFEIDDKNERGEECLSNTDTYQRDPFKSKRNKSKTPNNKSRNMNQSSLFDNSKYSNSIENQTTLFFDHLKTMKNQIFYSKGTSLAEHNYGTLSEDFGEDSFITREPIRVGRKSRTQSTNERNLDGIPALNFTRNKDITNTKDDSGTDNCEDDINRQDKNKIVDSDNKLPLNFIFQNYMKKNSQNNIKTPSKAKNQIKSTENTSSKIKNNGKNVNQLKQLSVLSPKDFIDTNLSEKPMYKKGMFSKNKSYIVDDYNNSSGIYDNSKLQKQQSLSSTHQKNEALKMEVQESHKKVIQEIERLKNSSKISTSTKLKPKKYF